MFRCGVRIMLVGMLILPAVAGCGSSGDGGEKRSTEHSTPDTIRTADLGPPADPRRQTSTVERGTTGWVGGLRLGVARASDKVGTVVVLEGRAVPEDGDSWQVSGKAGHSEKLDNGYTVRIDEVVDSQDTGAGAVGSGGGSVTITVTPPG